MENPLKTVHPVFHSNIYASVIIDLKTFNTLQIEKDKLYITLNCVSVCITAKTTVAWYWTTGKYNLTFYIVGHVLYAYFHIMLKLIFTLYIYFVLCR